MEVYIFDPLEVPAARRRWEERREACQDWHDRYEETRVLTERIGRKERKMVNTIKTAEGVVEAGPDDPALLKATATEEAKRGMLMGAVGRVTPDQAGILEMGGISVTEEMVRRARGAAAREGVSLDPVVVRGMLEAAFGTDRT